MCRLPQALSPKRTQKPFKFLSKKNDHIDRELCLPFYALFCLFSPFPQLHSPLCAFEKWKNILKKTYKNFKNINLNSSLHLRQVDFFHQKGNGSDAGEHIATILEKTGTISHFLRIAGNIVKSSFPQPISHVWYVTPSPALFTYKF